MSAFTEVSFKPGRALIKLLLIFNAMCAFSAGAQAPFPPPAAQSATNINAVLAALNASRPELSTHLEIDAPEVAVPGAVSVAARSTIPGTTLMVLLNGGPGLPQPPPPSVGKPGSVPLPPLLILAGERIKPNSPAQIKAKVLVGSRQWVTLLAFAQGRWFIAVREIKVGRAAAAVSTMVLPPGTIYPTSF